MIDKLDKEMETLAKSEILGSSILEELANVRDPLAKNGMNG